MTATITDPALDILDGLDFTPPCSRDHDVPATHLLSLTCGCSALACAPHAERFRAAMDTVSDWSCAGCNTYLGHGNGLDFLRVVPL